MSDLKLGDLERDVENARARLSKDLSVLRSPAMVSTFGHELKREAIQARDQVIRNLQSSARSTALDLVQQLKAKASANPAAALVIGAGLAWRLIRNPPIASVLVGAGLFSLLRTTPMRSGRPRDFDYLEEAKTNLRKQASGFVEEVKERGSAVAADVTEQARQFTEEAMQKAQEWGGAAGNKVRQAAAFDRGGFETDELLNQQAAEPMHPAGDQDMKNKLLLGVAGLAVAFALGINYRRRLVEN